jgi:hypothetical protein
VEDLEIGGYDFEDKNEMQEDESDNRRGGQIRGSGDARR